MPAHLGRAAGEAEVKGAEGAHEPGSKKRGRGVAGGAGAEAGAGGVTLWPAHL